MGSYLILSEVNELKHRAVQQTLAKARGSARPQPVSNQAQPFEPNALPQSRRKLGGARRAQAVLSKIEGHQRGAPRESTHEIFYSFVTDLIPPKIQAGERRALPQDACDPSCALGTDVIGI